MTHIWVSNLTITDSDNGLSPDRRQAIICTNAGIVLFGPLGTNFSENLIGIQTFSFYKMHLKMPSAKWCPFCLGLNVLIWLYARTPDTQPHLLTHTSKSHLWSLISKIYHILGEICKVLHVSLLGLCQSPCLLGLFTSGCKTCGHITESQTTSNILGDVILRWGLNSCHAGTTICLQFGKSVSISNNIF